MRLQDTLNLAAAARYQAPANPGDKLPCVYGDFISPQTRGAQEQGGCLPTVLINRLTWTFLLSDSTIADAPIEVYARQNSPFGQLVPSNLYTILRGATGNVEGQGFISAIQFNQGPGAVDPTQYEITWRGYGSIRADGTLINDPVSMIQEMFTARGNWTANDFDQASVIKAIGIARDLAIPVHWVFMEDQPYGQILAELFENYLADTDLNHEGKLRIRYNLWPMVPLNHGDVLQPYLSAEDDVLGDDPEDAVSCRLSKENLVNHLTVRWRHNWAQNIQGQESSYTYQPSFHAHKARMPREFTLRGIRTESHLFAWGALFLSPLVDGPKLVEIPLKSLAYHHFQRGTFTALDWSAGPDPLGRGWTQRVLRVLETQTNYLDQTMTLKAFDTGLSVIPPQAVPFLDQDDVTWYLRINPSTELLEFVSTIAFPWTSVGTPRHWVTRVANDGSDVWIYPSPSGVMTIALSEPTLGSGDGDPCALVDWHFQRFDVAAASGVGEVVKRRRYDGAINLIPVP